MAGGASVVRTVSVRGGAPEGGSALARVDDAGGGDGRSVATVAGRLAGDAGGGAALAVGATGSFVAGAVGAGLVTVPWRLKFWSARGPMALVAGWTAF